MFFSSFREALPDAAFKCIGVAVELGGSGKIARIEARACIGASHQDGVSDIDA
jgi:hypothetical protein